ncbi:SdpI family protein [Cohnella yongneupensis]|uniref:SdpI family protein n=1 Tax=Cohnella yongneupensis TaxID=425006 RepID=A0ABW0QSJ2_9BACL
MDTIQIANIILSFVIGSIFYLSGVLLLKYPPKSINALYGYRTFRSMKNQDLWNEGNNYSAEIMKTNGLIIMIMGILLSILFKSIVITILIMGLMILSIVLMFVKVEKRLKIKESDIAKKI